MTKAGQPQCQKGREEGEKEQNVHQDQGSKSAKDVMASQ